MIRG
jgi:hypothetical protein